MCRHDRDCPATLLSVESYPEYRLRWKLIWGTLLAVLGMFLILFSVNTLYWLAYFILNKCSPETEENAGTTNRLWPATRPANGHTLHFCAWWLSLCSVVAQNAFFGLVTGQVRSLSACAAGIMSQ